MRPLLSQLPNPVASQDEDYTLPGVSGPQVVMSLLNVPMSSFQHLKRWYYQVTSPIIGDLRTPTEMIPIKSVQYTDSVCALVKPDGTIAGALTKDGLLYLCDEPTPMDAFNNPRICLDYSTASTGSVSQHLALLFNNRAEKNNTIPWIQQEIHQKYGLTGKGVLIRCIEEPSQSPDMDHSVAVQGMINDKNWGVAPGATTEGQYFKIEDRNLNLKTEGLSSFVERIYGVNTLNNISQLVLNAASQPTAQRPHILNFSWGLSRDEDNQKGCDQIIAHWSQLLKMSRNNQIKDPLLNALVKQLQTQPRSQWLQTFTDYTDYILDHSLNARAAQENYLRATFQAEQAGIVLITSAGNENGHLPSNTRLRPDAFVSELGMSPYVISVAATDTQRTPTFLGDDRVAAFSTRGMGNAVDNLGRSWNPSLAAPGNAVLVNFKFGKGNPFIAPTSGTSFAAPYVAGVVALMLEANPSLTPAQIRWLLAQACENPRRLPVSAVGAGMINPVTAVLSAKQLLASTRFPVYTTVAYQH